MIESNYIKDTIETLEIAVQEESLLEIDDYQEICLKVLLCEKIAIDYPDLTDRVETKWEWFNELTDMFYEKMLIDLGDEDEN